MLPKLILHCLLLCFLANFTCVEEKAALAAAGEKHRPIVAVFLGEDCPWSKKLKRDVLNSPIFLERVNAEAVLWISSLKEQSTKYQVEQCPLFLLLDPQGKEFARVEYSSLDAQGYASALLELIDDFQQICTALDQEGDFDQETWQELYRKAKKMSVPCFQEVILEQGIKHEDDNFFHLEKYATLMEKHKLKHPVVRKAKHELLGRSGVHFQVAALEFRHNAERFKPNDSIERAVKPLVKYIQRFGKIDPENYWKAEWLMAEFLFSHGSTESALEHAELALKASPSSVRPELAETISFMRSSAKK
jgi:thioredoxin-related protein